MEKPQPIGAPRKQRSSKDTVEQVSFRMSGRTKRRFVSLISARGLEIKEVLVEFIERYIEFEGSIGVVRLQDRDAAPAKAAAAGRTPKRTRQ
jgi:hypothetical protein